jgi:hypothetical protein
MSGVGGGGTPLASLCFERHLAIATDLRRRASSLVDGESHLALKAKGRWLDTNQHNRYWLWPYSI